VSVSPHCMQRILSAIEEHVFSPRAVAYLTRQVRAVLKRSSMQPMMPAEQRVRHEQELTQARTELENVKTAIRHGIITETRERCSREGEAQVANLEARAA